MPDTNESTGQTIGFVGLGLMGQALTARLVETGHDVVGYDINPDALAKAAAHGVRPAGSLAELAGLANIIQLCVTSTAAVVDIVEGAGGLMASPGRARIVVDHSTTAAGETRQLAQRLTDAHQIEWVDAPVSGGPPAARAGTLAIIAGGSTQAVASVQTLMNDVAGTFTHMGPVGAGQVTKIVNQILVLNNYCVLAEALTLAEAGGVDASKVPEALGVGHAGSNMLQSMYPRMVARDFAPAGYARQVLKDLDMVGALARDLNVPTPMSSQAASLYRILVSKGHAELDGIAVLKLFDPEASM
tara:strand:- start:14066 stop:14968 length:903 start_codon:yes stop_codon:yes gene_type:complete